MRIRTGSTIRGLFGVALVLAALVGQALPASAQGGAPERYVFYLEGSTSNRSLSDLCVGDVVNIQVKAQRFLANKRASDTATNTSPPVSIYGVTIEGTVGNPEVGRLFVSRRITQPRSTPPGLAEFKFTATKAGTTGIVFKGTKVETGWLAQFVNGNRDFLSTELEATVVDCEYSVSATSRWHGFNLDYTALVSDIRIGLTGATGHGQYSGSGTWTFMITENPGRGGCAPHTTPFASTARISGELHDDNLLIDIEYYRPMGTLFLYRTDKCWLTGGSETLTQFPETVTVTVPLSGGASRALPQDLLDLTNHEAYIIRGGSVTVTVERVRSQWLLVP